MPWEEFSDLMCGLGEDTPLGRVVRIRTEDDPEALREMSPAQRRMRREWQRRRAENRGSDETRDFIATMQGAFARMFGEGA